MPKVLLIEDDDEARRSTGDLFRREDWTVLEAGDGQAGIDLAIKHRPDVILCDLLMPGTNGFDVLDRLQGSSQTSHLPVVLFTIKQLTAEEKERLKGRVDAFAPKQGFKKETLVGIVNQVLHHNAAEGI